jgi:hypothetical protein
MPARRRERRPDVASSGGCTPRGSATGRAVSWPRITVFPHQWQTLGQQDGRRGAHWSGQVALKHRRSGRGLAIAGQPVATKLVIEQLQPGIGTLKQHDSMATTAGPCDAPPKSRVPFRRRGQARRKARCAPLLPVGREYDPTPLTRTFHNQLPSRSRSSPAKLCRGPSLQILLSCILAGLRPYRKSSA